MPTVICKTCLTKTDKGLEKRIERAAAIVEKVFNTNARLYQCGGQTLACLETWLAEFLGRVY